MKRIVAIVALSAALVGCEKAPQPAPSPRVTINPNTAIGRLLDEACRAPEWFVTSRAPELPKAERLARIVKLIELCEANGWRY